MDVFQTIYMYILFQAFPSRFEWWLGALFWTSGPFRSESMKRPWWWVRISFLNASAIKAWVRARCKASWWLMVKKSQSDDGSKDEKNCSFSLNAQTTAASLISNINANINGEASNRVFKRRINQRPGWPSRAVLRGMGLTPSKLSCQRRSRPEVTLNPFGLNHLGLDTQTHVFGSYGPSEGVTPTCMILICTYVLFREDSIENLGLPCVFLGGCFGCSFFGCCTYVIATWKEKELKTWGFKKNTKSKSDFKSFLNPQRTWCHNDFSCKYGFFNVPSPVDMSIREPRWWAVLQSVSCAFARILPMGCGDVLGSSYVLHRAWRKNAAIIMKLGMEKKTGKFLRYAFRAFVFCLHFTLDKHTGWDGLDIASDPFRFKFCWWKGSRIQQNEQQI